MESNVYLPYGDELLENHCRLHGQLMDVKGDYSSPKKALCKAAKALNELDWAKRLEAMPNFIVAGEVEFTVDIKATAPAAKYMALKSSGLI